MADDTQLQEIFEKLFKAVESGNLTLEKAKESFGNMAKAVGASKEKIAEFTTKLNDAKDSLKEFINFKFSDALHRHLEDGAAGFKKFKAGLGDGALDLDRFALKWGSLTVALSRNPILAKYFGNLPAQFTEMGSHVSSLQAQLAALPGLPAPDDRTKKLLELADADRNVERNMLMTAAATGQLSASFDKMGTGLKGLPASVAMFNKQTQTIGDVTGTSSQQVSKLMVEFMKIPGALSEVNAQTTIAGRGMHQLTAQMAIAAGTGKTNEQVLKETAFAVTNLGLSAEKSLTFIAELRDASEKTGMPMEKITELAQGAAGAFAAWGDNTAGTISMIEKLGPNLRNAGATLEQTQRIIGDATGAMAKMTTAQRAFLSSQTGGPGGLQGAFQIELLMKQGKTGEVMDKLRQNMLEKLGPLVSMEQAGSSSDAAMQYQKQRMFMMSPAMGGMAKDERSADMLLEAMSKGGEMPKLEEATKRGSDNLEKAVNQGTVIQDRMRNELVVHSNYLQAIAGANSQTAGQLVRRFAGNENVGVQNRFKDLEKEAARETRYNPLTGDVMTASGKPVVSPDDIFGDMKAKTGKLAERGKSFAKLAIGLDINEALGLPTDAFGDVAGGEPATRNKALKDVASKGTKTSAFGDIDMERATRSPENALRYQNQMNARRNAFGADAFLDQTKPTEAAAGKQSMTTNVAVTTVCSECTKKIATTEAKKAVDMALHQQHQHNKDSIYHPQ